MKIKLFTHTDLDGIGCAVVAKTAFTDVDVTFCDYVDVNEKILDFLENDKPTDYYRIFITDISFNDEVAERLDLIHRGGVSTVTLIDHHATALHLSEKYPWCLVNVNETPLYRGLKEDREALASGTSLFYKFLKNKHVPNLDMNPSIKGFAEHVRRYDTWEWHNVYQDDQPKKLNDLLWLLGREKFIERFVKQPVVLFSDVELTVLELEQHRMNKYIWNKKRQVDFDALAIEGKVYKFAYVFAEQYTSLLGNAIAEEHGDNIDFVVIIDLANDKVSLRGIHNHIHLGQEIAKSYGGGGHAKASGFETLPVYRRLVMKAILGNYVESDKK